MKKALLAIALAAAISSSAMAQGVEQEPPAEKSTPSTPAELLMNIKAHLYDLDQLQKSHESLNAELTRLRDAYNKAIAEPKEEE